MSWLKVCGSGLVSMCGPVSLMGFVRLAEQATMAAYITAADNRSCAPSVAWMGSPIRKDIEGLFDKGRGQLVRPSAKRTRPCCSTTCCRDNPVSSAAACTAR